MFEVKSKNKGKQGTKGAKQIYHENQETLRFYLHILLISNVIFYCIRLIIMSQLPSAFISFLSVSGTLVECGCLYFMHYMARPQYPDDPGTDLNMSGGLAEHTKDVLLVTVFVRVFSLVSGWVWLFWLVIPGRAFHMLWNSVIYPWLTMPSAGDLVDNDSKKQRKQQRRVLVQR